MKKPTLHRRDLLRLLGMAGAASLLPTFGGGIRESFADPPAVPRRVVFFYTEHGTLQQNQNGNYKNLWVPNAPGAPAATSITTPWSTTAHTLGELHQPLTSWKDDLLFVHGLDMVSSFDDPTGAANAHYAGQTHAMTGIHRATGTLAGGISIDQFIAKAINSPKPLTLLPSLELFVDSWGGDAGGESSALYAASGQPIALSGSASKSYDRLFPNGPIGTTPAEQAARQKALAQQKSVLDWVRGEYDGTAARSSKLDRERLSAHSAAINDLKNRIDLPGVACTPLAKSVTSGAPAGGTEARYTWQTDVMMRLTQTALACDLTRVATLYLSEPPGSLVGYKSVQGTSDLHDLIHKTHGFNSALLGDATAVGIAKSYHAWHATQFAKLLTLLDAIPEADGGTLLDHTLVVWCGQLASGDHALNYVPYVLAGKMGGAVTPGRYVRYPRKKDTNNGWNIDNNAGLPHNMLYLAIAQAMGVSSATFGGPAFCPGPLTGLV